MQGICVLCGYIGDIHSINKQPELYICLNCYIRFYAEKIQVNKEEDEMGWNQVDGKSGGKDPDILDITPNTAKLIHILLPDTEEPVSYWSHYIPNKSPNGPKGAMVICPGRNICPACANGTFTTRMVHAINVWDYETKSVKILEGGNQTFQPLKQVKDQIGTLLSVDFSIKKTGSGRDTSYSVVPIPMMQPFDNSGIHGLFPIANLRMPDSVEVIARHIEAMSGITPTETATTINPEVPVTTKPIITHIKADPTTPTLQFGKYKGRTVADVYLEDPNYIKWCADNISDPTIKTEAKRIMTSTIPAGILPGVISDATEKHMLINDINEMFQFDERYKGNFALILEKMRVASISPTHPAGKTILMEYTTEELNKLIAVIK